MYKDKYLKYKKKYRDLKFKSAGAGHVDNKQIPRLTDSEHEIINREFNLELVKKGARLAFLLELSHYPNKQEQDKIVADIKNKYTDISSFIECKIKDEPHRILYYLTQIKYIIEEIMAQDNGLAKALGFQCVGIPNKKYKRISSHYIITDKNSNKVDFYSEICLESEYKVNNQRLQNFQNVADNWNSNIIPEKFQPPYTITHETNVLHNKFLWINLVMKYLKDKKDGIDEKNEIDEKEHDFFTEIKGDGLSYLIQGNVTLKELLDTKSNWVLYTVLRMIYDPLGPFYPFTQKEVKQLEEFEKKYFINNYTKEPYCMLNELKKKEFFKELVSENKQQLFDNLLNNLNYEYKKLLKELKK